jgi:predicted permease
MNIFIKYFLFIFFTFIFILWFQNNDDKKYNKNRISIYEKYKFPLLISSIVGLIINLYHNNCINNDFKFKENKIKLFNPNTLHQQIYIEMPNF